MSKSFLCSWSGGKDCALAFYRATLSGAEPALLLSIFADDSGRSRSHGLSPAIVEAQAQSIGLPLVTRRASWSGYEEVLTEELRAARANGIDAAVFGDIDLEPHREWEERVCAVAGLEAVLPLWQEEREALVAEFIAAGFSANIVSLQSDRVPREFLGRELTMETAHQLRRLGVDPCGEEGEFHTVVTNGPLFTFPLRLLPTEVSSHSGYLFQGYSLA